MTEFGGNFVNLARYLVQYEFLKVLSFEEIEGSAKSNARNSDLIFKFFQIHFWCHSCQHTTALSNGVCFEAEKSPLHADSCQVHRTRPRQLCSKRALGHAVLQHTTGKTARHPPKKRTNLGKSRFPALFRVEGL